MFQVYINLIIYAVGKLGYSLDDKTAFRIGVGILKAIALGVIAAVWFF